jgi:hypothetical protein
LGEIGFIDRMRVIRLNQDFKKFEQLLNAFAGYILVNDWPKFWDQEGKKTGGANKLPWPLAIVANLVANGIPEKRAWEMPECQAVWMNAAFAMRKGVEVAIMSPEEEAFIEEELKREAEAAAAVANPAG